MVVDFLDHVVAEVNLSEVRHVAEEAGLDSLQIAVSDDKVLEVGHGLEGKPVELTVQPFIKVDFVAGDLVLALVF
jgi:hypothetical protein